MLLCLCKLITQSVQSDVLSSSFNACSSKGSLNYIIVSVLTKIVIYRSRFFNILFVNQVQMQIHKKKEVDIFTVNPSLALSYKWFNMNAIKTSSWHQQRPSRGSREKTAPSTVSPILNPSWKTNQEKWALLVTVYFYF